MCGIAGILNLDGTPASSALVQRMTDAIAHRGPDGEGVWCEGTIAFGHRRLAIIDLSAAGHQPMATPDGRYIITYNGEVYNFRELRVELESKGRQFHSRTDTEVILNAFAEWGVDALNRFNGMFAFGVWDKRERTLTLARDRYGIKPLYYIQVADTLLFASEIKALLTHPLVKTNLDYQGLLEYFTFQNYLTDRTLFDNISVVPAGCYITAKDKNIQTTRYWDFEFVEPSNPKTDGEYLEELDYLFRQAVSRQLVSDVDINAYLSGGMDSGAITAIAAKQVPWMRTFTCGFDLNSASGIELGFDERAAAEHMSYLFKTEHYEVVLKSGDMERIMPHLAYCIEEPRVGQSYPNYYVAQLASKFGKVVLAGTGGDEIFAGYPWRYYQAMINSDDNNYIDNYYQYWQRLIPQTGAENFFKPIWQELKHIDTRDIFKNIFKNKFANVVKTTRPEDYINNSLYFDAKTFLHGLLSIEDKLSMAHSLETRVPFLDNDLVDFAMKLPARLKLGGISNVTKVNQTNNSQDGKLLLRRVMEKHIPKEVVERRKQGFSAPDASWFKGESIDYIKRKFFSDNAFIYKYTNSSQIKLLINEHLEGKHNHRLLIWALLSFEEWGKTWS
ncbi:asparagine synthase (glutamine-hydrolyzing) [soil metagenome]